MFAARIEDAATFPFAFGVSSTGRVEHGNAPESTDSAATNRDGSLDRGREPGETAASDETDPMGSAGR